MATQTLPFLPEDQAKTVHRALRELARSLTEAFESLLPGDAEDQLKSHMRRSSRSPRRRSGFEASS